MTIRRSAVTHRPLLRRFAGLIGLATLFVVAGLAGCGGDSSSASTNDLPLASADESSDGSEADSVAVGGESTDGAADESADEAGAETGDEGPTLRALPPADGVPSAADEGPRPVSLDIPSLNISDSTVRPVGVETNGEFEVPIASEVGWYRFGSGPGEEGSTVMAAHIAFDGEDGVFRYLSTVENGSEVEVELDDGSILTYEIVDRVVYDKTRLPFEDIFSESGPDRLVLITCGGEFNPELRSYESNVVAYAELVS